MLKNIFIQVNIIYHFKCQPIIWQYRLTFIFYLFIMLTIAKQLLVNNPDSKPDKSGKKNADN